MTKNRNIDPGYREQLDIQDYAEKRRQEIQQFIERENPRFLNLHEAMKHLEIIDNYKSRLYAIIDPQIVAALDYSPVRIVTRIAEVTAERKRWLVDYWLGKYEIEVDDSGEAENFGEWKHEVGLRFRSSYWEGDHYESYHVTYDYPSCLISTFAVSRRNGP